MLKDDVAMCQGRTPGPYNVDDENLAGGLQAKGLQQPWQVLSGTEFGTHKGVLSFAIGWTWWVACCASRCVWQMDLGARVWKIPALALVGGPPLTARLKLAMHIGRTLARSALQSLPGHDPDRRCQICQASVGSVWHRCYKCTTSAELRRGYFLDKWSSSMIWTRLMLADPSYGQDVPKPIRHEHVVWEVHPVGGELDARGFGDGSLRHGRMKRLARGGWGAAVLTGDMKVTAKLHGPLPRLHQDITLAESVAFLWYLRHVSATGGTFYTRPPWSCIALDERPASTRRPGDESGSASTRLGHTRSVHISFRCNGVKGHATMQHVRAGTISLWQLQANELADEQAKNSSPLHPSVAQVEQSYSARASFLGWLAKFLGRLHTYV